MTIRTTTSQVEFGAPFKLNGDDEILPAGIYQVDIDEEAIEAIDRTIYRRIETRLRIETVGRTVHRRIEPVDLEAALRRDREAASEIARARPDMSIDETSLKVPGERRSAFSPCSLVRAIRSWVRTMPPSDPRSEP